MAAEDSNLCLLLFGLSYLHLDNKHTNEHEYNLMDYNW